MPALPPPEVTVTADSERHWRDLGRGLLTVPWCESCNGHVWYPKFLCPRCQAPTGWRTLSGEGEVYSFSIVHRGMPGFDAPYVVAYISVDGGPTLLGSVVGENALDVRIGDRVRLAAPDSPTEIGRARFARI